MGLLKKMAVTIGFGCYVVLVPLGLCQNPAAAGVVLQANHATIGGAGLSSGASVFAGDLVQTDDEGQVQIQAGRIKLALQPNSSLRMFRQDSQVVVELEHGTITYSTAPVGEQLTVYALDVRLSPTKGMSTVGQVTVVSRCETKATSQTGTLEVTSGKETKTIEETKTYSVRSDFGVEYHDSWKPVPADYPDFDPNTAYHRSHSHAPCGLADVPREVPRAAMSATHFKIGAAVIAGGVTCLVLCRSFESPDGPKMH